MLSAGQGTPVALTTPKEQSNVLCRDDLKSELGSLPAEAIFLSLYGVYFALVKDALVVSHLCAQKVEDNASKLVGGGCDRLRSAEFAGDTAEEFAQIVFGVV